MPLTDYAIRAMGFDDLPIPERLSASFCGYTVYETRGLAIAEGICKTSKGTAAAVSYQVAVSKSLNGACRALSNDDFTDDEPRWMKERRTWGPFALVQVGPTGQHEADVSRMRRESNGLVQTYDEFASARAEVRSLEGRALPRIVSALTCAFSKPGRSVSVRTLDRIALGQLSGGGYLHDARLEVKAEVFAGRLIEGAELETALDRAATLAPTLNDGVARFVSLGTEEPDQLRRFLFFFLALERETNAAFRKLDHDAGVDAALAPTTATSTKALLQSQVSTLKNLYDRFAWCAACAWKHLDANDVTAFKQLKKTRDSIAHGELSEPPAGHAKLAEELALRISGG